MNTVIAKQLAEYKHKILGLEASGDPPKKDEPMSTLHPKNPLGKKGYKPQRITLETKDAILHWYKQGYNGVQISQKLGIPASVASYHITKYRKLGFKRDLADTKHHVEPKKPATPTQEMRHRGDKRPYQQRITTEKLDLMQTIAKLEAKVEVLKEMLKEERELNSRTRNR